MKFDAPTVSFLLLGMSTGFFVRWLIEQIFAHEVDEYIYISLFLLGSAIYARVMGNIQQFAIVMNQLKNIVADKSTHINITKGK